ncbi:MAG: hypothetical protein ACYDH3_00200 [Candidatus Aminicenantales bacterium]
MKARFGGSFKTGEVDPVLILDDDEEIPALVEPPDPDAVRDVAPPAPKKRKRRPKPA